MTIDSGETVELKPSFLRWTLLWIALFLVGSTVAYFWQGYHNNLWWPQDYILSLLIPFLFMLIFVWIAFVPTILDFSATQITIKFPLRQAHTFSWDDLDLYYPVWGNVFMIQFNTGPTFQ